VKKLSVLLAVVLSLVLAQLASGQDEWDGLWAFIGLDGKLTRSVTLRPGEAVSVVSPPSDNRGEALCAYPGGGFDLNGSFIVFATHPGSYEFTCAFVDGVGGFVDTTYLLLVVAGDPIPGFEATDGPGIQIRSGSSGMLNDSAGCMNCADVGRRVAVYQSQNGDDYHYVVKVLESDGNGGWSAGDVICGRRTRLVEGADCSGLTTGGMGVSVDITQTEEAIAYTVWVDGQEIVYGPYPLSVEG
jgi:hypothetical protein